MNAQAKGNDLLDDSEDILDDELYNYSDDDAAEETTTENEIF